MSEFQKLYEHGKIFELLELARNSSTETGKLWEIDALLLLERFKDAKLRLGQYDANYKQSADPEIRFNSMHVRGILETEVGDISIGRTYLEQAVQIAESHKLDLL
ncbi:MAG: hypothetical protein GPJ54_12275 [Candidatus Heimdallarchaeota archaeon]|nr:hypothetical protein [Candidatus Heimdallarchaeota archaeon]